MKYSNRYTIDSGNIYFSNVGIYRSFALIPIKGLFSLGVEPRSESIVANVSFVWNSICLVAMDSVDDADSDDDDDFFKCFAADSDELATVGRRSKPQNIIASTTGTHSITNNVVTGVKPIVIRPA